LSWVYLPFFSSVKVSLPRTADALPLAAAVAAEKRETKENINVVRGPSASSTFGGTKREREK
jgi:hypothetical protein